MTYYSGRGEETKVEIDEDLLGEIQEQVESDWDMHGLSFGLYADYSEEVLRRYILQKGLK